MTIAVVAGCRVAVCYTAKEGALTILYTKEVLYYKVFTCGQI